ncbi:hypothetical protein GS511_07765 [Leptospira borgpetersenii]|uniref:Uncharacterized protein n=2 Tax=Leptospira borgpetersenii TaxID=174 RepID=A0A0E3AZ86_LEPBO|nr:hypothetical protein LBBP_01895 [Leptospira borgpetersenii serovar Ballum]EKR02015.1 hypothetical protein LEP1GSC121_3996 [Leptospira borgpetersenii serovar Castellonis str. 200801910]EMK08307.1 hypothetical protein LEP1GSC066_1279 [Leptospira sp. serovar Kenya str. Sh9]EMN12646.1 hypothetical protein LEP1GSC055_2465 [Leptospira borgpetersenii str. Brem 307]EMN18441.1 hypothetical protein LEP1GSC056_2208 [Leptospira borgpetersenii str. Brem 328]EMO11913.1 hypothetical protein LEP1GSC137_080
MYFIRFSLDPPIVSSEHLPYCSGNNFQKCFFIYLRMNYIYSLAIASKFVNGFALKASKEVY